MPDRHRRAASAVRMVAAGALALAAGVARAAPLDLPAPSDSLDVSTVAVPRVPLPHDQPAWFAGFAGLIMTRSLSGGATTSVVPGAGAVLSTTDAGATWPGGIDVHLGRWFGRSQRHGLEAIYWGVYGIGSTASVTDAANGLDAIPQAAGVAVGSTAVAADFLADSRAQRIARDDIVNDIEFNWLFAPHGRPEFRQDDAGGLTCIWLAGFRFFQLSDALAFTSLAGSVPPGATFGYAGGSSQLDLDVATTNNLYGGQLGAKLDWHVFPRVRISLVPKGMLAGNAITASSSLATGNGVAATFADDSPVRAKTNAGTVAWLGSADLGVAWDIRPRWSLFLGYRVVGVGNVALADDSWPTEISSPSSLSRIDANGSTFVHGAFAGFEGRH